MHFTYTISTLNIYLEIIFQTYANRKHEYMHIPERETDNGRRAGSKVGTGR